MIMLSRVFLFLIVIMLAAASMPYAAGDPDTKKATEKPMATVEGTVSFVEPDGTLIVKNPAGKSQIVYLRSGVKVMRNGQEITRKDVKAGDVIRAKVDSMKSAREVQVLEKSNKP